MSQEVSAFVEQLVTLIIMAAVITVSSFLLFTGINYFNGSYEYIDTRSTHVRDTSFNTKYQRFITETKTYPVASIAHEFNSLDDVVYTLRLKQASGLYTSLGTVDKTQMEDYYHLKAIVRNTTNQNAAGRATIVIDME